MEKRIDRSHHPRSLKSKYLFALVCVAIAIGIRLALAPMLGQRFPFGALNIAVLVTAWYGGTRPALAALFVGALVSNLFILGVHRTLGWGSSSDTVGLLLFLGTGVAISLLAGAMHEARRRADAASVYARFRDALIDKTYEPFLIWELGGPILLWNNGAENLYGFTREEAIGRVSHDLLRTEMEGGVEGIVAAIERDGRWEGELKHFARDGRAIFVDSHMALIRDEDGTFVIEANRDITELKNREVELLGVNDQLELLVGKRTEELVRTNENLRAAEERTRLILEGVRTHAISMLDPKGNIVTWSRGAETIAGYTADEIIGQHYSCLFTSEGIRQRAPELELALAAAEGTAEIDGWRIRKDGSTFWSHGTLAALYDENGKAQGFAKITQDLTTKRHDDELLQSVLNHTMDGIITIDARGTISMMNRAGEVLFGRSAAEVIGQNVNMLMPQPYHAEHDGYLDNYTRTGEAKVIGIGREVHGMRKDGHVFPIDLAVTEFQLDSKRYFVGIVRDISERRTLETQLQQSQKMEAFGQLAGGVAHDFNNLLTVIFGYAEFLKGQLEAPDPKIKMVDQIIRAGERAASLTQQLLAFSRQQVLETRVINVNAIVTDIESMLRRLIGEDMLLSTVLQPNLNSVKADPGQIGQVITNFCINARDAMPKGGKITIETKQVELDESYTKRHPEARTGPHIMVAVSDTGCGMEPEVLGRIFEPFFTTKGVGQGTGLGLAVVHGIIKQSGGSIDVYSEVNVGTTFRIYLPAVQSKAEAEAVSPTEHASSGRETVLLVEDEESLLELGTMILEKCGYTVLVASNGEAALELIGSDLHKIDLLITDVVMPRMGGRKLAETLQAQRPELKVLFLSGYTDDAVVRHGVLQANVNFLQKPFSLKTLSKKVREILDEN